MLRPIAKLPRGPRGSGTVLRLTFLLGMAWVFPARAGVPAWIKIPAKPASIQKATAIAKPPAVGNPKPRRPTPVRRRRYAPPQRPPALLSRPSNMPLTTEIPMAVVALLAEGEIDLAARRLYLEPATAQSLFLIREMQRVGEITAGLRRFNKKDHQEWLNLGIAYHNLYLMTKQYKRPNQKFLRQALRAYKFAARRAEGLHRDEAEILCAALEMAAGKTAAAQRRFAKRVDTELLAQTFQGATYLATYHAAAKDVDNTIAALTQAKRLDANHFLPHWIALSFDFAGIRDEPAFQKFVTRGKIAR